ncbi:putative quinol monooxygenase [Pseudonocardia sp. H11422]|uniref:putative quinol monooxygenase n=1 Tax=Pseudonocardia sp. H11422 TaxID=2835866 RepID=UPI001BDC2808|nr:putative quinol monooxygenase [Pseudonocardia sp. H11422]
MSRTDEQPVVVVATITPAQGREAEVEAALREAIPQVHDEPGCLLYALHREPSGAFVFVEKWSSAQALKVHSGAAALAAMNPKLEGILARPAEVHVLTPLPEGALERGAL